MRIVLTGSSGRLGRAIFNILAVHHSVVGIDRSPFSTTHLVGDFTDPALLRKAVRDSDAIIHCAALHAPHVGTVSDDEFRRVNVEGTRLLAEAALSAGVSRLIFTSTTALYGHAVVPDRCIWIDEDTVPQPKSIYHRTKLEAERLLEDMAGPDLQLRVLRMSRSFPEPANVMAAYRLHRGIDIRDVADAHAAALINGGDHFQRHIIAAGTLFKPEDCEALAVEPPSSDCVPRVSPQNSRNETGPCHKGSIASTRRNPRALLSGGISASVMTKFSRSWIGQALRFYRLFPRATDNRNKTIGRQRRIRRSS